MGCIISCLLVALAACGTTQSGLGADRSTTGSAVVGTTAGSDVECQDEMQIGSSIPRKVCRSKTQNEIDHDGAAYFMVRNRATPCSESNPSECFAHAPSAPAPRR